jgi:cytochrome c oxidase subunit IV
MNPMAAEITDPDHRESAMEVRKATRIYLLVGLVLFCGTFATVAIATIPWLDVGEHGFDRWDALLGLGIAATKASLVAAIFMHLNHERRLVYGIACLAGINVVGCFVGTYWHYADMTNDPNFYLGAERVADLSSGARHPGQGKNNPPIQSDQETLQPPSNPTPAQENRNDRNP